MAKWRLMLLATMLAVAPTGIFAQADEGGEANSLTASEAAAATLDCRGVGLRIMAAEVSGARFVCQISGAPSGDASFTEQALSTADQIQIRTPLCTGTLAGGAGTCSGSFIDRNSTALGQVSLAVTLQPSGAALGPVVIGPSTPAPAASEPMQFYPLPEEP